ncbi:MAG: cell division protein ZapA [Candidatus Azotimanducaceae bacterium]|jgi:cell division protein ZapA
MPDVKTVSVSILGKDYQVSCKPDEIASLMQAAQHLDQKMKEIKTAGSILGLDRIAVMAALNISNDYLAETKKNETIKDHQEIEIKSLSSKLDTALNKLKL